MLLLILPFFLSILVSCQSDKFYLSLESQSTSIVVNPIQVPRTKPFPFTNGHSLPFYKSNYIIDLIHKDNCLFYYPLDQSPSEEHLVWQIERALILHSNSTVLMLGCQTLDQLEQIAQFYSSHQRVFLLVLNSEMESVLSFPNGQIQASFHPSHHSPKEDSTEKKTDIFEGIDISKWIFITVVLLILALAFSLRAKPRKFPQPIPQQPRPIPRQTQRNILTESQVMDPNNTLNHNYQKNQEPMSPSKIKFLKECYLTPVLFNHLQSNECCPICLEDFVMGERVSHLSCRHQFHEDCMDNWIHKNNCPLCKQEMGNELSLSRV